MMPDDYPRIFEILIGHEGGFTDNRSDPGNWTGGSVGAGVLRGTKYGISAASYPGLNIAELTLDEAREIYKRDYFDRALCGEMPGRLALVMFDAAVNNGVSRAVRFLQWGLGVGVDGIIGPVTRQALAAAIARDPTGTELAIEAHAQRIFFMAGLSTWTTFGLGWSRRLARLPAQAAQTWPEPPPAVEA
jgi:lysozyme family protein